MSWSAFNEGASVGTCGSEEGIIERDEEHSAGARITLERDGATAPYTITCGVYGWMFHTRFFSTVNEANGAFDAMKDGLVKVLDLIPQQDDPEVDAKCQRVCEALAEFVIEYP